MDGNQAILDRPAAAVPARTGPCRAIARPWCGPWIELGVIRRYEWNRSELTIDNLPPALDGFRIVQFSDLHLDSAWHPGLDDVLARLHEDPPDLLLITGDFVDDKFDPRRSLPLVDRLVARLPSRHGAYAVGGNHDGDAVVLPRVARAGVNVLSVGMRTINVNGAALQLIGLAGLTRGDVDTQDLLYVPPRAPGTARVVLSHYPDAILPFQRHNGDPDLFFAGHTHGGQVCLPGRFPILRHDTLPRRYCKGVHRVGDTWLVVSRGMGFSTYAIRVFCPAEVVEVVLRAGTR